MSGTALAQDHLVTLISLLNMDVMNYPRLTISITMNQVMRKINIKYSWESLQKKLYLMR